MEKTIKRNSFFWNAVYAGINALQSAIILLAVSRKLDISFAGMLTIGFTIGNLSATAARYGIRNFQVTDVREQYSFSDYFHCRIITFSLSVFVSAAFLLVMTGIGQYSPQKGLIVFEVVVLKGIEAVEEVFVGRLQQQGRLDIGARIASIRIGISTIVIFLSVWWIQNLAVCILLGIISGGIIDVLLIPSGRKYTTFRIASADRIKVKELLFVGLPLCIGITLHNYIGNGPKYLVDIYLPDGMQAICGYIMMPMFVLTILNLFIMQPAVKALGEAWNKDSRNVFRKMVIRHISMISVLMVMVLIAGYTIGLPILSRMYQVDLLPYRSDFLLLMIGGGFFTITAYLIVLLTTMRKLAGIVWGCGAALAVYIAFGGLFMNSRGFSGACMIYILANVIMAGVFLIVLLRKKKHFILPNAKNAGKP